MTHPTTKERAETVDYPTTAVPPASDPDAWTEVPERIAAAIEQHLTRRYVSLWWLKSAMSGPGFSDQAVEVAADQGLIRIDTKHDLNPMGVRVARLIGPQHVLADWDLALDEDGTDPR